jgi:hypothetical protein
VDAPCWACPSPSGALEGAGASEVGAAKALGREAGGASGASGFEGSIAADSLFGSETQAAKERMLANTQRVRRMGVLGDVP